jgi:hypothetical protein
LLYGLGGVIAPFIAIKFIDVLLPITWTRIKRINGFHGFYNISII